jgi:hypothetical protein
MSENVARMDGVEEIYNWSRLDGRDRLTDLSAGEGKILEWI